MCQVSGPQDAPTGSAFMSGECVRWAVQGGLQKKGYVCHEEDWEKGLSVRTITCFKSVLVMFHHGTFTDARMYTNAGQLSHCQTVTGQSTEEQVEVQSSSPSFLQTALREKLKDMKEKKKNPASRARP